MWKFNKLDNMFYMAFSAMRPGRYSKQLIEGLKADVAATAEVSRDCSSGSLQRDIPEWQRQTAATSTIANAEDQTLSSTKSFGDMLFSIPCSKSSDNVNRRDKYGNECNVLTDTTLFKGTSEATAGVLNTCGCYTQSNNTDSLAYYQASSNIVEKMSNNTKIKLPFQCLPYSSHIRDTTSEKDILIEDQLSVAYIGQENNYYNLLAVEESEQLSKKLTNSLDGFLDLETYFDEAKLTVLQRKFYVRLSKCCTFVCAVVPWQYVSVCSKEYS